MTIEQNIELCIRQFLLARGAVVMEPGTITKEPDGTFRLEDWQIVHAKNSARVTMRGTAEILDGKIKLGLDLPCACCAGKHVN